jgi:lipoprotein NlpI
MFKEGRVQFEAHQNVNRNDVENAAWHFLCVASLEGAEAARKALISIQGDRRVPMAQIHDLFADKGTEEAVIKAAGENRDHLCYAHLYLALYKEALGKTEEALKHYKLAAEDHKMPHYMGETARVFYESRKAKATKKEN